MHEYCNTHDVIEQRVGKKHYQFYVFNKVYGSLVPRSHLDSSDSGLPIRFQACNVYVKMTSDCIIYVAQHAGPLSVGVIMPE